MDAETILADLRAIVPGAALKRGHNDAFYWASVTTEQPNGQTHTYSTRLDLNPTALDIQIAGNELKSRVQDE